MTGILNLLAGAVSSVVKDTYFNLVSLLLPGDGTNGAQNNTFLDSSTNNFTITRNGNTTQGTFSPFSQTGWSNYLNGDYLAGSTNLFATNTSTFTIEAWLYPTALNSSIGENIVIGDLDPIGATLAIGSYINNSGQVVLAWYDGASKTCVSADTISLNQWSYVAIVVNSNSISMYVNSTTASSLTGTTTLTNRSQTNNFTIGMYASSFRTARWVGYLSNIRVSTVARSISSIPTAPYTSDANTRLLTCQSNRFVDNSSNGFTLTPSGTPSVQAFEPFAPGVAYSAATVGGSGYFDGTGDYLTVPSTSALAMGTGDFCLEMWIYPTAPSGEQCLYANFASGGVNTQMGIFIRSGNSIRFSSWDTTFLDSAGGTIVANAWHHLVVCRSGNNGALFINGARQATSSGSPNNFSSTDSFSIGRRPANDQFFPGYICGLRSVKGSSVYDPTLTTLTLPTAPPTAITNTSLLTNFTNAGITDATAKNDLETVGNAQISTTQSKFGGSSMSFDGSGDSLDINNTQLGIFSSGDFTIECWIYFNALPGSGASSQIIDFRGLGVGTNVAPCLSLYNASGTYNIRFESGSSVIADRSVSVSTGTWYHLAAVRSSGNVSIYWNGTISGTAFSLTTNYSTGYPVRIGAYTSSVSVLNGYIDDLRVTRGYARYTANFTPTTAALPLQ